MSKLSACRPGSAWHTWQNAGYSWSKRQTGPQYRPNAAAQEYFENSGFSGSNAQSAITRAFLEGAAQERDHGRDASQWAAEQKRGANG